MALPDGTSVVPAYEPSTGRLASVTTAHGTVGVGYDPQGRVSAVSTAEESLGYGYDGFLVTSETWTGAVSGTVGYGYDNDFRVTSQSVNGAPVSFGYDADGLLTSAGVLAIGREPATGRISGSTLGTVTTSQTYSSYGEPWATTARVGGSAVYSYTLDRSALSSRIEGKTETIGGITTTTAYGYDALGNLRAVLLPSGARLDYVVDGANRRIGKKVNGVLAEGFLYEGKLRPVAWLDGTGQVKARFVYGTRINVPEYMVTTSGTYRILTDHLGSPRLVVDSATGAIAQRMDYDEWGVVLADSNPGFQPFGFAGGIYDRDTGLVRFGARDYEPRTGRWTSKDRARFRGGLNFYEYCDGDPVNYIDPRGRMKLPATPSGLPPEWAPDLSHTPGNGGGRWVHPGGDALDFDPANPMAPPGTWEAEDHWHWNKNKKDGRPKKEKKKHYRPGDEVPDPQPACSPTPEQEQPTPADEFFEDMEFTGDPWGPVLPVPFWFPRPIPIPIPIPL